MHEKVPPPPQCSSLTQGNAGRLCRWPLHNPPLPPHNLQDFFGGRRAWEDDLTVQRILEPVYTDSSFVEGAGAMANMMRVKAVGPSKHLTLLQHGGAVHAPLDMSFFFSAAHDPIRSGFEPEARSPEGPEPRTQATNSTPNSLLLPGEMDTGGPKEKASLGGTSNMAASL